MWSIRVLDVLMATCVLKQSCAHLNKTDAIFLMKNQCVAISAEGTDTTVVVSGNHCSGQTQFGIVYSQHKLISKLASLTYIGLVLVERDNHWIYSLPNLTLVL